MVRIAGFQPGLAGEIVDLWRRSAPADPISAERFRNLVLLDANFDPEGLRLAFDGDDLVGAAYAVRRQVAMVGADLEPERGWLSFFFVGREPGGTLVGRGMFAAYEDRLRHHAEVRRDAGATVRMSASGTRAGTSARRPTVGQVGADRLTCSDLTYPTRPATRLRRGSAQWPGIAASAVSRPCPRPP